MDITSLEGITKISNLEILHITNCNKLINVEGIMSLKQLQELYIDNCNSLDDISDVTFTP